MTDFSRRIGFGPRFGAALLDAVFLYAIGYIFVLVAGDFFRSVLTAALTKQLSGMEELGAFGEEIVALAIANISTWDLVQVAGSMLGIFYYLSEVFTGATPGKMVLGLQVANQEGSTVAPKGSLFMRYFIKFGAGYLFEALSVFVAMQMLHWLALLIGVVVLVGAFFIFGKKRQTLWDMIAKTSVMKKVDVGAPVEEAIV